MKQVGFTQDGKIRFPRGKRVLAAVVCLAASLTLLPGRALAVDLDRSKIFVSAPEFYPDNSVKSLDIQYTYPTGQGTSQKCNVVLNHNIGSGGSLFGKYGNLYTDFEESLNGIGGVVTYDGTWKTVAADDTVNTTANFVQGVLPLTGNAKYYVYMWSLWGGHYYPDELLVTLEVKDGKLYYTTDVDGGSGDIPVTEHQLRYALSTDSKTITETCSHCTHSEELTIDASSVYYTSAAYTGAQLSYTTDLIAPVGAIQYYKSSYAGRISGGTLLSAAPADPGYYYATVTLGDKTAAASFSISLESHAITVSTDGNGTASASPASAVMGATVTLSQTPNRGYVFSGWQVLSGGVSISSSQFSMPNAAVSVKATFVPDVYGITYRDQGGGAFSGTHGAGYPTSYTYKTGVALKDASKANFFFDGWFDHSACTGTRVNAVAADAVGDKIFYAKWRAYTYTVTATPSSLTFGAKSAGYATAPLAQTVTVKNTGNSPVTLTAPASTATYTVLTQGDWSAPVAPNGTRTFTVQPVKAATQSASTYSGTFTVGTDHGTSAQVTASFKVNGALSVGISGDLSIVSGESTELTANPAGGTGSYRYQWSGGGISDTTQSVTVHPAVTTEYTVTVTDQGDSSKSASATVTVTAQSNSIAVTPASHSFGTARTGYADPPAAVTFTVAYTGNFFVTLNEPDVTNAAATAHYTISKLSRTGLSAANPTATFTVRPNASLPAGTYHETLTVNTLLAAASTTFTVSFTVSDTAAAPVITEHPADVTVASGSTASFSVAATGDPAPSYQWQVDTGAGFSDIPGETDATYVTGNTTPEMNGYRYRCVVSNFTTQQNALASDPATLTLTLPMTITPRNSFVQGGAPANLTVTVGESAAVRFSTDFASATLNGAEIFDGDAFDGEDGSIVLRFRRAYLNTLTPGKYALRVTIVSGAYADGTIIVTAPGGGGDIPKAGDDTPILPLCALALVSCAGLCGLRARKRRRAKGL